MNLVECATMWGRYLSVLCLFATSIAGATEVDSYTLRFSGLRDITSEVDAFVNNGIRNAIAITPGCDESALRINMVAHLNMQLIGGLERHLITHPRISRSTVPFTQSIYRDFPFADAWVLHTVPLAMGPLIYVAGHYVGADKFGHFFTEGYELYHLAYVLNRGEEAALLYSQSLEQGFFGAPNTGIQSHGDQAANYAGMVFWRDFIRNHAECTRGRFVLTLPFRSEEYVDLSWDEANNCNQYARPGLQDMVDARLAELTAQGDGTVFTCPMQPDACDIMRAHYGDRAPLIITPRCLF